MKREKVVIGKEINGYKVKIGGLYADIMSPDDCVVFRLMQKDRKSDTLRFEIAIERPINNYLRDLSGYYPFSIKTSIFYEVTLIDEEL